MIEINELTINVPDMTPEEGLRLANDVAEHLSSTLPHEYSGRSIDSLDIRLSISATSNHSQLADDIATHIRYQMMTR